MATSTALLGRWFVVKRPLAALVCGLALLSACSDDSSSSADPPTTATTSPSDPTSSPTEEAESPEDFVKRWVDADTHMQNTGNGSDYREMSAKCSGCREYADRIEGIYKNGGYVKTRGWIILGSKVSPPLESGQLQVTIRVNSTPTEYVEESGGEVTKLKGAKVPYIVTLDPQEDSWTVVNAEQVAQ